MNKEATRNLKTPSNPLATPPACAPTRRAVGRVGCIAAAVFSVVANAATPVSGGIISGQRWSAAGSPYEISGDLRVNNLEIGPGVTVLFRGAYEMEVTALLAAKGTREAPIVFTSEAGIGWKGLRFNGSAPECSLEWCTISRSTNRGVHIVDALPQFRNCTIVGNSSEGSGAGIFAVLTGLPAGQLELRDCTIRGNVSVRNSPSFGFSGGGIAILGRAILTDCIISDNACATGCQAWTSGEALGGGALLSGTIQLVRCKITGNRAHIGTADCFLAGPEEYTVGGGGIAVFAGDVTARNCIVAENRLTLTLPNGVGRARAFRHGAGVFVRPGATCELVNVTVAGNTGGVALLNDGNLDVVNSIVFDNPDGTVGSSVGAGVGVFYSDLQGWPFSGSGNINRNPAFADSSFHLEPFSPCVDAGDPAPMFFDKWFASSWGTKRNDMGAYGGPDAQWDRRPVLIRRQPFSRFVALGGRAHLSVRASGTEPISYQWMRDGEALLGQTSPSLTMDVVSFEQDAVYSVVVSNEFGAQESVAARLWVRDFSVDIGVSEHGRPFIRISGPAGRRYLISYTEDLGKQKWTAWKDVTSATEDLVMEDLEASDHAYRFYKVVDVR